MPNHANTLRLMRYRGKAWSPLPGVYAHPEVQDTWETRVLSAHLWAPELVFSGGAAAKLGWWSDLDCPVIGMSGAKRKSPSPWLAVSQAKEPPEFIWERGGMKLTSPPLSAVQLAATIGPKAIDEALRRRVTTLPLLHQALEAIPCRPGNKEVRQLLHESKENPWSALEREAHRLLRTARITGWKGNYPVMIKGRRYYLDIAFPGLKLAIELDGWGVHSDRVAFVSDRERQNDLLVEGWIVLRFSWEMLDDLVPTVRAAMK